MVTKEQALTENEFHFNYTCNNPTALSKPPQRWRRNGKTQTWKRKANLHKFRVPVKYGMWQYGDIDERNANLYHIPSECPRLLDLQLIENL